MNNQRCYCGANKPFEKCCGAIISGNKSANTALELMKSRYAAYASGAIDYLIHTTHPSTRHLHNKEDIKQWSKTNDWLKLEILSATLGGIHHDQGEVEFKACFKTGKGIDQVHHEKSKFIKEAGKWYYLEGKVNPTDGNEYDKTGRNDACPCGSGKKYKKCCG